MVALETFGIDRLMFAVDYPYASNEDGRAFLNGLHCRRVISPRWLIAMPTGF
jgi:predicted TIM-barrel fold metal-dependent hydrolase